MSKRAGIRCVVYTIALALIAAICITKAYFAMTDNYRFRQAVYGQAFSEVVAMVGRAGDALNTAGYASSREELIGLYSEINTCIGGIKSSLGRLPLSCGSTSEFYRFLSQTAGYMRTVMLSEEVGETERRNLVMLASYADRLSSRLTLLSDIASDPPASGFDGPYTVFDGLERMGEYSAVAGILEDYPGLVYDGPFSDGSPSGVCYSILEGQPDVGFRQIKAGFEELTGGAVKFTSALTECCGTPVYRFFCGNVYAEYTVKGGRLLRMGLDRTVSSAALTSEEALTAAERFVSEQCGIRTALVDHMVSDGLLTASFAPVAETDAGDVLLLNAEIKCGAALDDGEICFFDAADYYKNSAPPLLPEGMTGELAALSALGTRLEASEVSLAFVPGRCEASPCRLVYRAVCRDASCGAEYICFIDAVTGERVELRSADSPGCG